MKLIIEDLGIRGPEDIFKTTKEIVADRIKPESESIKRFREISLSILLGTIRLDRIDKMKLLINTSRKLEKLEERLWNKYRRIQRIQNR
jgi:hypothetical protein